VQRVVVGIAASPYFLPSWWDEARGAGRELGPGCVEGILGAMVHPPGVPEDLDVDAAEWVFRNQLAGALLLAHVDSGWGGSRRREALLSLVDGVVDWTTQAAIIALRELALDEPAALDETDDRLWELRNEVPWSCDDRLADTLACSYLRLPGTRADRRQTFQDLLAEAEEG
jgi:hypothetical protein